MPLDYEQINQCLDEVEQELLRVGRERCDFLQQENQLTAVILLLLRSASLFRAMVEDFRGEKLDALDAVRRAFFESWLLAFQFRMQNEQSEVGRWFARTAGSSSAQQGRLENYARERGHNAPNLGRDYGQLSEVAHPTRKAAENSAALIVRRLGMRTETQMVEEAITALENQIPAILYRLLWLILDEHQDLMPLHVEEANMPTAVRFADEFPAI